jgi:hypothetical protein
MCRDHAGGLESPVDLSGRLLVDRHFDAVAERRRSAARPSIDGLEQVPLVYDRVAPA